jgi:hypothetical protein
MAGDNFSFSHLRRKTLWVGRRAGDHRESRQMGTTAFGYPRIRCFCSLMLLLVAACQTGEIKPDLSALENTAKQAQKCREAAAHKPEYQVLQAHMPLAGIGQADLRQMADTRLVSSSETVALTDWSNAIQQCRDAIVTAAARDSLSGYVPIVLAEWDRQDRVVVQLVQGRIPWGEAVLRLRESRTALLTGINEESKRQSIALTRSAEAERANRAALLNAFTRLVP